MLGVSTLTAAPLCLSEQDTHVGYSHARQRVENHCSALSLKCGLYHAALPACSGFLRFARFLFTRRSGSAHALGSGDISPSLARSIAAARRRLDEFSVAQPRGCRRSTVGHTYINSSWVRPIPRLYTRERIRACSADLSRHHGPLPSVIWCNENLWIRKPRRLPLRNRLPLRSHLQRA